MYLVNGFALHKSLIAQWLERPASIREAMGSIPVWGLSIFLCVSLVYNLYLSFIYRATNSPSLIYYTLFQT